jgi:quinol-cytochrome oxidoreductase complex cytochrome b subunit
VIKFLRNMLVVLACASTGVYMLWKLHSLWGALGVALALVVAVPTEVQDAVRALKGDASDLQPVIDELKKHT